MSPSMWIWRVVIPCLGLLLSGVILWQSWQVGHARTGVSDPASTTTRTAPRPASSGRIVAEGRIVARPGAQIVVGTEDGGTIAACPAAEKRSVHKGDLLVVFRSADQEASLAEARAKLAQADVELAFQQREIKRRVKSESSSKTYSAELDAAHRDLDMAAAQRQAAVALVNRCKAALERTRVTSPIDGTVMALFAQPGETVAPATRFVEVVDLARLRVEAEVDEFDVGRITSRAVATITAEGRGLMSWSGTVEEIPDRVVERDVRPEDPGRPSDARVLRVKIALDRPTPLKLGQRVGVEIRTGSHQDERTSHLGK